MVLQARHRDGAGMGRVKRTIALLAVATALFGAGDPARAQGTLNDTIAGRVQGGQGNSRLAQFLSDHPNPGNRERAIEAEVGTLPRREYGYQTGEFARMKSAVAAYR